MYGRRDVSEWCASQKLLHRIKDIVAHSPRGSAAQVPSTRAKPMPMHAYQCRYFVVC